MSATDADGDGDANLELLAEAERESDVVGGAVERRRHPARDVAGVVEVGEVACVMAQCRLRVVAPLTRASAVPGRHTVTAHVRRPARAARHHRPTERRVHEVRTTSPRRCTHHTHTRTHTRLTALCPGLPRGWAGTRKVKPIWILLKQETVSGSGISWAICKYGMVW